MRGISGSNTTPIPVPSHPNERKGPKNSEIYIVKSKQYSVPELQDLLQKNLTSSHIGALLKTPRLEKNQPYLIHTIIEKTMSILKLESNIRPAHLSEILNNATHFSKIKHFVSIVTRCLQDPKLSDNINHALKEDEPVGVSNILNALSKCDDGPSFIDECLKDTELAKNIKKALKVGEPVEVSNILNALSKCDQGPSFIDGCLKDTVLAQNIKNALKKGEPVNVSNILNALSKCDQGTYFIDECLKDTVLAQNIKNALKEGKPVNVSNILNALSKCDDGPSFIDGCLKDTLLAQNIKNTLKEGKPVEVFNILSGLSKCNPSNISIILEFLHQQNIIKKNFVYFPYQIDFHKKDLIKDLNIKDLNEQEGVGVGCAEMIVKYLFTKCNQNLQFPFNIITGHTRGTVIRDSLLSLFQDNYSESYKCEIDSDNEGRLIVCHSHNEGDTSKVIRDLDSLPVAPPSPETLPPGPPPSPPRPEDLIRQCIAESTKSNSFQKFQELKKSQLGFPVNLTKDVLDKIFTDQICKILIKTNRIDIGPTLGQLRESGLISIGSEIDVKELVNSELKRLGILCRSNVRTS